MNHLQTCVTALLVSSSIGFLSGVAFGETYTMTGTVVATSPVYKTEIVQNPVETCEDVQVPIYETSESKESGDVIGSLIIGGLIGGAIGNNMSDADGAGTAGAVLGSIIGANEASKGATTTTNNIVGYRQVSQCSTTWVNESRNKLSHYRITYTVLGLTGTLNSVASKSVGDSVPVTVTVSSN